MASPGNQHCASCIGTLSFPVGTADVLMTGIVRNHLWHLPISASTDQVINKGEIRTFNTNNKEEKTQYNDEKKHNEEENTQCNDEEW